MTAIATLLGLNPVKPFVHSKAIPLPCADPSLLMGIELEIEGIKVDPTDLYVPGLAGEADNSLRPTDEGVGWEYITKPATFSVLAFVLGTFFSKAKLSQEKNYSERCSVHVHANVQDLEPEQLKSITLLYQVMERVFYGYAGNDRDMNIFCVPWSETTITHNLIEKVLDTNMRSLRNWQKYTGLNLIPVTTQGTIEFRHLPGTCDLNRILGWLNMIGSLFAVARKHSYTEIEKLLTGVNTTSEYRGLLKFVFGQWESLVDLPNIEELLEEGALNTKYILLSSVKENKLSKSPWFEQGAAAERDAAALRADVFLDHAIPAPPRVERIRQAPIRRPGEAPRMANEQDLMQWRAANQPGRLGADRFINILDDLERN